MNTMIISKKKKIEVTELKNTITKLKIILEGLNHRLDEAERKIELEDRTMECIQTELDQAFFPHIDKIVMFFVL